MCEQAEVGFSGAPSFIFHRNLESALSSWRQQATRFEEGGRENANAR